MATHLSTEQIAARLDHIRDAPRDDGTLALIVRRPAIDAREVLEHGELTVADGLVGDTWKYRGSSRTPDFRAHPNMQINVMNVRVIEVLAQEPARWPLAGDQHPCPQAKPIKGNQSSMIAHSPGQQSYLVTNPEACFTNLTDAAADGYRPAKR